MSLKPYIFILAALVTGMPSLAGAQDASTLNWRTGSFPIECATRDLQLITQLEQYGESQYTRGEVTAEAFWTLMGARQACYEARVSEGLALYDSIQERTLAEWAR
jgi:hypothetical protein